MNYTTNKRKVKDCSFNGCTRKHYAKGYCVMHYTRYNNYGDASYVQDRKVKGNCKAEGCKKDIYIKGHCTLHYQRMLIHGDANYSETNRNPPNYCEVESCESGYFAKGMCKKHYDQVSKKRYLSTEKGKEESRINCQKRRARKKNAPFNDYSIKEWQKCLIYFDNKCAYCNESQDALNQEHVLPISKGGSNSKSNIIPSCGTCNSSKGTKTIFEWYHTSEHFDKERKERILNYLGYRTFKDNTQLQLF